MRVHGLIESTKANGPGDRAGVWLQGCIGLNCAGCQNLDTHAPNGGEFKMRVELVDWICAHAKDGVTFSGGEPMQQLDDGLDFVVRKVLERRPDLSVGFFTGYALSELESGSFRSSLSDHFNPTKIEKRASWLYLKSMTDFAVMGRYNQLQHGGLNMPLCSSRNQKLELFSNRYTVEDFHQTNLVEMVTSEDGDLYQITGFPQAAAHAG